MNVETAEAKTKTEVRAVDLVTRMLELDLVVARQHKKFSPVREGEHVVGVMSENLERVMWLSREVYEAWIKIDEELKTFGRDHLKLHDAADEGSSVLDEHDCDEFHERFEEMRCKALAQFAVARSVKDVFWGMMHFEFPELVGKRGLDVREGCQVVWVERDDEREGAFFVGIVGVGAPGFVEEDEQDSLDDDDFDDLISN